MAEDDANHPGNLDPGAPRKLTPRHMHAEFDFEGSLIHVDWLRFMSWGPLSGHEEFQFFVNGEFHSRGGYSVLFGTRSRATPACLRMPHYAIIGEGYVSDRIPPEHENLSAWRIEPE